MGCRKPQGDQKLCVGGCFGTVRRPRHACVSGAVGALSGDQRHLCWRDLGGVSARSLLEPARLKAAVDGGLAVSFWEELYLWPHLRMGEQLPM